MGVDTSLLARFLRDYPFQPATALWRSAELRALIDVGLPEGRGLDLGCGDGLLTRILLERTGRRRMVGVEPDPAEAGLAERLGIYEAIHVTSGAAVPEPDASFDWVLSNSVLEHVDDLEPVLEETARVLRPGGRFLFTVPSEGFHACLRGPWVPGANRASYLAELDRRLYHLRYWPGENWPAPPPTFAIESTHSYLNCSEVRRWELLSSVTAGALYIAGRRRRRPIEIQRRLGLRRGARMPEAAARHLAALLARGLSNSTASSGCELVVLRRL